MNRSMGLDVGGRTMLPERTMSDASFENMALYQGGAEPPCVGSPVEHLREHVAFAASPVGQAMSDQARARFRAHLLKHVDSLWQTPPSRITDMRQAGNIAIEMLEGGKV